MRFASFVENKVLFHQVVLLLVIVICLLLVGLNLEVPEDVVLVVVGEDLGRGAAWVVPDVLFAGVVLLVLYEVAVVLVCED